MKKSIIFFLLGICPLLTFCQNTIGLPEIVNYPKRTYGGGTQNWDICQDRNQVLYFANNEGLLSFDGSYWKLYPLPNKTIVRSVAIGSDKRIYVGAQDEFGYFSPGKDGQLLYFSLRGLIPEKERSFTDVWDIVEEDQHIFFRTSGKIFELYQGHISLSASPTWTFLGRGNKLLIAQNSRDGLCTYKKGGWVPIEGGESLPKNYFVTGTLAAGRDTTLITTLKHGVFFLSNGRISKLNTPALEAIANNYIYDAALIDNEYIALATRLTGCIIIDKKGNPIQSFSRQEGLQNNNILRVFADKKNNIWLGLDNGVDFIAYDNAIKNITPDKKNEGSGYSAIIHDNSLYIGTTNGLYEVPLYEKTDMSFIKGDFTPVANNAKGQIWNLSEVNGRLFMGHHEGSFIIERHTAIPFDNTTGFWNFFPMQETSSSPVMIAGSYRGVSFYDYANKKFINNNIEAGFESSRFITIDNNDIWASHPYKGVFRVQHKNGSAPVVQLYGKDKGLETADNYVFKIKNRLIVATGKGIYEYDYTADRFEPSAYFGNIFGPMAIRYLKEDRAGNIWFVYNKNLGVVDYSQTRPSIIHITELNSKMVSGFEQVYPVNENNIFVGAEKGYFHINYAKYKKDHTKIIVQLREVRAIGKTDSLLFGGYFTDVDTIQTQQKTAEISYKWNSFHFEFSSPLFEHQSNIEYSYMLQGYDKKWSAWTDKTEKEYMYLPAGNYTFRVKARNNLGNESADYTYDFVVLPPWYQTWWAWMIYACIFVYAGYLLYRAQKRKFIKQRLMYEEEQGRLQYLHQLELDKNEKEIVALRNEKLEAEIRYKNKEVASASMHLVKKGELITKMKDELQRLTRSTDNEKSMDSFKKMIKTLGEDDKMDKDWEHFTIHFDKVHNDFFIALKEKHTNLTPNEMKLCAYLRMNLCTKEMAQLMNISVRGVEISRYRLRKKLQISKETNLFTYLLNFHSVKKDAREGFVQD